MADMIDINNLPIGAELETKFITHREADEYRKDGWEVEPLKCHHGAYSMLAVRVVDGMNEK